MLRKRPSWRRRSLFPSLLAMRTVNDHLTSNSDNHGWEELEFSSEFKAWFVEEVKEGKFDVEIEVDGRK